MKTFYKIILTINATMLMPCLYLVKEKCWIPKWGFWSIIVYIGGIILFMELCLAGSVILKKRSLENAPKEISVATDSYMAVYLGYFFVTFSLPSDDWITFFIVYLLVNVLIFNSQTIYFNPLFCLLGYNFYEVHTKSNTRVYIISKEKEIKSPSGVQFQNLRQINEFTYLDEGKKKWTA